MCTDNYSNVNRLDEVIAKIKWCSFFASQCMNSSTNYSPISVFQVIIKLTIQHWLSYYMLLYIKSKLHWQLPNGNDVRSGNKTKVHQSKMVTKNRMMAKV